MYRLLAYLLGICSVAIAACCPLFHKTRKEERRVGSSWTTILLVTAMIPIFAEHLITKDLDCRQIELWETVIVVLVLMGTDVVSVHCFDKSPMWTAYAYLSFLLCVAFTYHHNPRRAIVEKTFQELAGIEHDSLFFDFNKPWNVVGRGGYFRLVQTVVPMFSSMLWVRYFFLVLEFICTLTLLVSPPIVAGVIQVLKLVGKTVVEKQLQTRLIEAEQRQRGLKPCAEMLLANVEEEYNDEVGFVTTEFA